MTLVEDRWGRVRDDLIARFVICSSRSRANRRLRGQVWLLTSELSPQLPLPFRSHSRSRAVYAKTRHCLVASEDGPV